MDLTNIIMCPDCKEDPPNLEENYAAGDIVCASCGLVVGDRIIDTRSEWRSFANDDQNNDDPSRVGDTANPLLNGSQLETSIGAGDTRQARNLSRLQNVSAGANDKSTKALLQAYKEIGTYCDAINISKHISEAAKHIFKLVDEKKALKGKPQEAIIAGCIFIACRQSGVPRTFREIHTLTRVGKKDIGKVFKLLEAFLQKHKEDATEGGLPTIQEYNTGSTSAESLCARYCSQLGFRNVQRIENISRELAKNTTSVKDLAGRSPLSVAAACIYMASHLMNEPRTSKDIANVAGVSDGTIKTAYKFLYEYRNQLVLPEWLGVGPNLGDMARLPQVTVAAS